MWIMSQVAVKISRGFLYEQWKRFNERILLGRAVIRSRDDLYLRILFIKKLNRRILERSKSGLDNYRRPFQAHRHGRRQRRGLHRQQGGGPGLGVTFEDLHRATSCFLCPGRSCRRPNVRRCAHHLRRLQPWERWSSFFRLLHVSIWCLEPHPYAEKS